MAWEPGAAGPAGRLHRAGGRDLAHGQHASCTPSTSATPCASSSRPRRALGLPEDRVPQLDEVTGSPRAADRLPLRPGPGARAAAGVLRLARRPRVPLHPVRPPPVRAALHARAGRDPRGHRPRQHARLAALRRAQAGRRRGRPPRRDRRRRCSCIADVFWFTIEFGVVREDGELRAYGAGILSTYGEIEEFRDMEIRPLDFAEMGDDRLRHHASTSRSCTAPSRWTSSRTSSAASSRRSTTTRPRG